MEEEKREKPKAAFEGEKIKELTESEVDVIGDAINPNGLPVQNGLDVDVKDFGWDAVPTLGMSVARTRSSTFHPLSVSVVLKAACRPLAPKATC